MEAEKLKSILISAFNKMNETYYEHIWDKRIDMWLLEDSKYNKLSEWCENKIESYQHFINIFSPVHKDNTYSQNDFKAYKKYVEEFAILIHLNSLLCNPKCNEQERENIEYTLCKTFNILYDKQLNTYIEK